MINYILSYASTYTNCVTEAIMAETVLALRSPKHLSSSCSSLRISSKRRSSGYWRRWSGPCLRSISCRRSEVSSPSCTSTKTGCSPETSGLLGRTNCHVEHHHLLKAFCQRQHSDQLCSKLVLKPRAWFLRHLQRGLQIHHLWGRRLQWRKWCS